MTSENDSFSRRQPGLEAQLADIADAIAYNHHDLDDGLRSGLLNAEELMEVRLFSESHKQAARKFPEAGRGALVAEAIRCMIDRVVTDLIETTAANLSRAAPADANAVRGWSGPLVGLSEPVLPLHRELSGFLRDRLYHHPRMRREHKRGSAVIDALFNHYLNHPQDMPPRHAHGANGGEAARARAVADYIAGMTDRYAIRRCRELAPEALAT